jgi:hypothetical protein
MTLNFLEEGQRLSEKNDCQILARFLPWGTPNRIEEIFGNLLSSAVVRSATLGRFFFSITIKKSKGLIFLTYTGLVSSSSLSLSPKKSSSPKADISLIAISPA